MTRTLVFTRTKHGADKVTKHLSSGGHHAPPPSTATRARTSASGRWPTSRPARSACWSRPTSPRAASTSTASRHVVNYDLPHVPESLRPPHRPHGARRRRRLGHRLLHAGRAWPAARHREDHPRPGAGDGTCAGPQGRPAAGSHLRLEPGRQGQARGASRITAARSPTATTRPATARASRRAQKPQGAKPQGQHQPKRDGGKPAAPRRRSAPPAAAG